jgi:hypothetical protein
MLSITGYSRIEWETGKSYHVQVQREYQRPQIVNPGPGLAEKVVVQRPERSGTVLQGTKKINPYDYIEEGKQEMGDKG